MDSASLSIFLPLCWLICRMGRCRSWSTSSSEEAEWGNRKTRFISWCNVVELWRPNFFFCVWVFLLLCYRFMIIPDMLKNAPMFKRLEARIRVCDWWLPVSLSVLLWETNGQMVHNLLVLSNVGQRIGYWSWPWACCCNACSGMLLSVVLSYDPFHYDCFTSVSLFHDILFSIIWLTCLCNLQKTMLWVCALVK
jgi:hypothetical protein